MQDRSRAPKDADGTSPSRRARDTSSKHASPRQSKRQPSVVQAWKDLFSGHKSHGSEHHRRRPDKAKGPYKGSRSSTTQTQKSEPRRSHTPSEAFEKKPSMLGRSELGRHVNENQMPEWLVRLLEKDGAISNRGIIPILQQLLDDSPTTRYVYLCSPCVQHISKLRREGSFCGYRNMQMLISYIIGSGATGAQLFGDSFPTIFQIQDLIENAWDDGYNSQGRSETGGVRGTRKYIGTPEAQAVFSSLQIPCPVQAFKSKKDGNNARSLLINAIEEYFKQCSLENGESKVRPTNLPPVYFQHRGHSMTIIGFERRKDGQGQLLVFDPSIRDSRAIKNFNKETNQHSRSKVDSLLEPYRRDNKYLRRYDEFELL